jgi:hypothetical protein
MSSQTEVIDSKHLPVIVLLYACSTGSHCTLNEANTIFHTYDTAFFCRHNILASYKNIIQPFAHTSMFGPKTAEDDLNSFIANKCTSLILLLYVTLQSRRHVSVRVVHHRGIFYMNIFQFFYTIHISLYNRLYLKYLKFV